MYWLSCTYLYHLDICVVQYCNDVIDHLTILYYIQVLETVVYLSVRLNRLTNTWYEFLSYTIYINMKYFSTIILFRPIIWFRFNNYNIHRTLIIRAVQHMLHIIWRECTTKHYLWETWLMITYFVAITYVLISLLQYVLILYMMYVSRVGQHYASYYI